jgi:dolichol-phosphate mannosyltransferase
VLSLILPTYNEAENLPILLPRLAEVLRTLPHEIIVVDDDSPDRTWEVAQDLRKDVVHLQVIRRRHKRGLSSAVMEGFSAAHGSVLAVMDGDGQHDPQLLRRLYKIVQSSAGIAVASRYASGGSAEGLADAERRFISRVGTRLAQLVTRSRVSDPLGGFFAIDAKLYRTIAPRMRPTGFKILLETLAALPPKTRVEEIPLVFQARLKGASKLSLSVQIKFFFQIVRLGTRRFLPGLFLGAMMLPILLHLPHIWQIHPLYLSAEIRSQAERALRWAQENEGWVLSDFRINIVREDEIVLRRTPSVRSVTWPQPCILTLDDPPFAACSES